MEFGFFQDLKVGWLQAAFEGKKTSKIGFFLIESPCPCRTFIKGKALSSV